MMTMFEWHDGIVIDYGGGVTFTIPETKETVEKIRDIGLRMAKDAEKTDDANKLCNIILDALDEVLGENATATMFASHPITPRNCLNAWMYLNNSVSEQYAAADEVSRRFADMEETKAKLRMLSVSDDAKKKVLEDAKNIGVIQSVPTSIKKPRL